MLKIATINGRIGRNILSDSLEFRFLYNLDQVTSFLVDIIYSGLRNKHRPYVYWFCIFSRPYDVIISPTFINFWNFSWPYGYFQVLWIVVDLRLFKALRLLFLPNFTGPTFILCLRLFRNLEYRAFGTGGRGAIASKDLADRSNLFKSEGG